MSRITGKRVIVTGGTRGIGSVIVQTLLAKGAQVLLCSRSAEDVEHVLLELRSRYEEKVFGTVCDVSDYQSVKAMVAQAASKMGGLDVLINNAGIGLFKNVAEMSVSEWQATIDTNLSGVFYCCHEAIPHLKQSGGGSIINIGSLAGKNPFAGAAAYCASKYGLIGFTEALMQEVRYDHIRVSSILPGSVNTGFSRRGEQLPEETWKLWPEDIAAVIVNLLETESRALPSCVELRPSEPKK